MLEGKRGTNWTFDLPHNLAQVARGADALACIYQVIIVIEEFQNTFSNRNVYLESSHFTVNCMLDLKL